MKSLLNILAIFLLLSVTSCEKHEHIVNYGKDGELNIVLSCANMERSGNTKSIQNIPDEGTAQDYHVKDYWLIQYNANGEYIENSAKYVEASDNTQNRTGALLPKEGEIYYCLFIANTHNPNFFTQMAEYIGTLNSMTQFYKNIASLDDTYNKTEGDLIMSGIAELKSGASELICKLYRNIAKLTVTIKNAEESGLTIKSINIKNIPGGTLYADVLLKKAPLPGINVLTAPYPNSHTVEFIDYQMDNLNITSGNSDSFVWYLPRNIRGIEDNVENAYQKNEHAPELATYIEIFATAKNDNELYRYRFYVGDNPTGDFNVEPNKHYNIPITFIDKGDVRDSRIADLTNIKLSGKSNCFIINPLPVEYQTIYHLPLTRIMEFWNNNNMPKDISQNTAWIAEVIWQDQNRPIVEFVNAESDILNIESVLKFKVKPGAVGNVLIGVREKGSNDYLWSWHLWITDYNPNEYTRPWTENKYTYKVNGGEIHRYAGEFWTKNYMNKYIMDRNLGALSANIDDGLAKTSGFMYQYGRKDPFPATDTDYYDINGNVIENTSGYIGGPFALLQGPVQIYESVVAPNKFVTVSSGDWVADNPYKKDNYLWNAPAINKSIFDPCPDGWRLPMHGVYDILYIAETEKANAYADIIEKDKEGLVFSIDTQVPSEAKEYNTAYFPATSVRNPQNGVLGQVGLTGAFHTLDTRDGKSNYFYPFYYVRKSKTVNPSWGSSKSKAVTVRCIREKSYGGETDDDKNNINTEDYIDAEW